MTITLNSAFQQWVDAGAPTTQSSRTQAPSFELFIDDLWSLYDYHKFDECDFDLLDKFMFDLFSKSEFNTLIELATALDEPA